MLEEIVEKDPAVSVLVPDDDLSYLDDTEGREYTDFTNCYVITLEADKLGEPDDDLAKEQLSGESMSGSFAANNKLYKQSRTKSGKVRLDGVLLLKRLRDKEGKFTADWAACAEVRATLPSMPSPINLRRSLGYSRA